MNHHPDKFLPVQNQQKENTRESCGICFNYNFIKKRVSGTDVFL